MRVLSHLLMRKSTLRRRFPSHALTAIEGAVEKSERQHRAEIRVSIEVALDWRTLRRVRSARERALEVFAELGVGNTREHNGVLIYVLLAERAAEILADSGLAGRVSSSEWDRVRTLIERECEAGRWRDGALVGIEAVTILLKREFPVTGSDLNEKADRPAVR